MASDYNCAIQECVEHQACFVERMSYEGLRKMDSRLRSVTRSTTPSEETLSLLLNATYYRSGETWNSRPVWKSTAAGGTKLCWGDDTKVWNIMSGGLNCDSGWWRRNGYVESTLVNGFFRIAYPTADNKNFGIFRCTKITE